MKDNLMFLVMAECRLAIRPDDTIEERCRASMKAAYGHWMVRDQDVQFRGAIAALLETANEDEKQRIVDELNVLKALNAALSGVPVDWENFPCAENPIGLKAIWLEVSSNPKEDEE